MAGQAQPGAEAARAAYQAPVFARSGEREQRVPIKGVRKMMAQAMVDSAFTAPHVTEWITVDVTATRDLVERLLFVHRPPGRDEPDWAAVIHVAVAPVYYHNYMLGELISAQLRNYLESHITQGPFYQNEVAGRYLLESFFGPGARENWRDTVLRATGEPLNPEYFVKSLG